MARGDPWRIMGGIYIPNPRFLIDSDFDPSDTHWFCDGWAFGALTDPNVTVRHASGFSDHRAMRIQAGNTAAVCEIVSSASPPGSIPVFEGTGQTVRLRCILWYKKTAIQHTITVSPYFYNADESSVYTPGGFGTITSSAPTWTKFDASLNIDLSAQARGFRVDHMRLNISVGTSAIGSTLIVDDLSVGYRVTNPNDASQAYDTLTARPLVSGLSLIQDGNGRSERTILGQRRYIDASGGNLHARLRAQFETALQADRSVWEHALALNRGVGVRSGVTTNAIASPPAPSPIVIEPFLIDPAAQTDGPIPENFYAWITDDPQWEPLGFLGNVYRGNVVLEEVG